MKLSLAKNPMKMIKSFGHSKARNQFKNIQSTIKSIVETLYLLGYFTTDIVRHTSILLGKF